MKRTLLIAILFLLTLTSCGPGPAIGWHDAGTFNADMTDAGVIIINDTRYAMCWISEDGGTTWRKIEVEK